MGQRVPPFQCSLQLIKQAFQGNCSSQLTLSSDVPAPCLLDFVLVRKSVEGTHHERRFADILLWGAVRGCLPKASLLSGCHTRMRGQAVAVLTPANRCL